MTRKIVIMQRINVIIKRCYESCIDKEPKKIKKKLKKKKKKEKKKRRKKVKEGMDATAGRISVTRTSMDAMRF